MDTSDPAIAFDEEGRCNHCARALLLLDRLREVRASGDRDELLRRIRTEAGNKRYDSVMGVSGGVDSSFAVLKAVELGLRPLIVHFDNGWNSELAVANIHALVDRLDLDLFTFVVDWEEFRDLQLSFVRASVANCEAPTDHGINATLFTVAADHGTRFILSGGNIATESILPGAWGHPWRDLRHLKGLHRRFGESRLSTMPLQSMFQHTIATRVRRISKFQFLDYFDYDRVDAKRDLEAKIGWRDYGGKHHESVWTRYFQGYYLPTKFSFDKRKAHLSSMICSGAVARDDALRELKNEPYAAELREQDEEFVAKKFGIPRDEWVAMVSAPGRQATDYPSNAFWYRLRARYGRPWFVRRVGRATRKFLRRR